MMANCEICKASFRTFPSYVSKGKGLCCSHKCAAKKRADSKPSQKVICYCSVCKEPYLNHKCRADKGRERYCSIACSTSRSSRQWVNGPCKQCGGIIFATVKAIYCSIKCARKWASGPNNSGWKGGKPTVICQACGKAFKKDAGSKGLVCSLRCWGAIKSKIVKGHSHPTGKGGKRADLGNRYFRSRWEANWARYLNWLKERGEVLSWEFEPDTFEFAGIKRGTRFYTPDFKVWNKGGSVEYHEVKGWNSPVSKTKLKRMAKYHPEVKIVLIDSKQYKAVAKMISKCIPAWEYCKSHGA